MNNTVLRKTLFLAVLAIFIAPSFSFAEQGPGEIIVASIDKGLEILKDPELQGMDKFVERRQKLWDSLKPVFHFEETAKRCLGRHWLNLSAEQRVEFTDSFMNILRDLYLGKSDNYAGEKIEYVRELVKGDRGKVQTNFYTSDNKQVVVDFSMHKIDDNWRIYDVIIEGVSMVSNYRSQFNSIMSKGSFEELMEKITEKEEQVLTLD